MSLFRRKTPVSAPAAASPLAELALKNIHDGVLMLSNAGVVEFLNPAAATMLAVAPENALGLDFGLLFKVENKDGGAYPDAENPFLLAIKTRQPLDNFPCLLVSLNGNQRLLVALSVIPAENADSLILTFRDIRKELAEEGKQAEFIYTASHEMRTPVATIDGYLSLALNPQTATIDDRARGYLASAENASKHLGKLFQDLLDVTKLDDGGLKPNFAPIELVGAVKQIADLYLPRARDLKINFRFGATDSTALTSAANRLEQVVYGSVDLTFLREIMDNLIDNALKYTPAGGSVYINVLGDGDRALINVTDTGLGISADDLQHIFQKFYRADNSDTRTIGGTGLGLYLVKQRVEAMSGRVWAESAFGQGSTFFVSLPRLSGEEYEKRVLALRNSMPAPPAPTLGPAPAPAPATQAPVTPSPVQITKEGETQ